MQICEYMHTRVFTAHPDMNLLDAQKVMHENHVRRLPVIHIGNLVGLLTEGRIRQSLTPYTAYSMSAWEFNWMLSRTKVKDIMQTELVTFGPHTPVEDALALSQQHKFGTILVVDHNILLGICTTAEISNLLIKAMGLVRPGVCLHISGNINDDQTIKAINIVRTYKLPIYSLFTITSPKTGKSEIIIHLNASDVTAMINKLSNQGYEVRSTNIEAHQLSKSGADLLKV